MPEGRTLLKQPKFDLTIERLALELADTYGDFADTCIIGLQRRGVPFAKRIVKQLNKQGITSIEYGSLDITFHRDDFGKRAHPLEPAITDIHFLVEDKHIVLVDDVLYTGRSIRAALTAIEHYGRPKSITLLCLIDRRFNRQMPISADFVGLQVDAVDSEYVKVEWSGIHEQDIVKIYSNKP